MKKQLIAGLLTLAIFVVPVAAFAQFNINSVNPTNLGISNTTKSIEDTIISIVNWVLALLGLIAVIMILYGGFVWLTAAGNEDKVASAKKVISAAIIGLIIVLLAYAIVTFVVDTTNTVTT